MTGQDLYGPCGKLWVLRPLRPGGNLAVHQDNILTPEFMGSLVNATLPLRIEYHLDKPIPVTEVNEYEPSVIPSPVDPPREGDSFAYIAFSDLTTVMCTLHLNILFSVFLSRLQRLEAPDLLRRQIPVFPRRKISQFHCRVPDPDQFQHRMFHLLQHPPHLMVSPFMDRNLDPGILLCLSNLLHNCRGSHPPPHTHPFLELPNLFLFKDTLYLCHVRLGYLMGRVHQRMRKVSIIRQEEKTLGIIIKPPYRHY